MSQWKPIETAPRDGSTILLWSETAQDLEVAAWDDNWPGEGRTFHHSHWLPIPKPPGWDCNNS